MQPEIHMSDEPLPPAPASDLLPPQRRKGVPRITLILGVCVLAAAAFLGGVQAQKQWGDNNSSGGRGNFAARFGNGGFGATGANGTGTTGTDGQRTGGFGGRGGGFTTGTVKMVQGSTIYVTTTDGNVVKVSVPAGTSVTKSVTTKVSGIKPGDTVTAVGTTSNGVVKATTVRIGDLGLGRFGGGGPGAGQGTGAQGGQTPPAP